MMDDWHCQRNRTGMGYTLISILWPACVRIAPLLRLPELGLALNTHFSELI